MRRALLDLGSRGNNPGEVGHLDGPGVVLVVTEALLPRVADGPGIVFELPVADGERLASIAAAAGQESFNDQVAFLGSDLEFERVFPQRGRGVQEAVLPGVVFEDNESVVLDRHLPVRLAAEGLDPIEVTAIEAEQVDHVDALVEQDAAAGDGRVVPPGGLVTSAAGLAVSSFDPQDAAHPAAVDDLPGLLHRRVEAVVETEHQLEPSGVGLGLSHFPDVLDSAARRLLAENVLAGGQASDCHPGNEGVRHADKHRVHVVAGDQVLPAVKPLQVATIFGPPPGQFSDADQATGRILLDREAADPAHITVTDDSNPNRLLAHGSGASEFPGKAPGF